MSDEAAKKKYNQLQVQTRAQFNELCKDRVFVDFFVTLMDLMNLLSSKELKSEEQVAAHNVSVRVAQFLGLDYTIQQALTNQLLRSKDGRIE